MLYALYVAFVGAFVAIAATGHVLLLMAVYPNLSGSPNATSEDTRPSHHASPQAAPPASKLAA